MLSRLTPKYRNYIDSTLALVASLVVKHQQTIELSNALLVEVDHIVSPNPEDWKYYSNLNGEYYTASVVDELNDSPIILISLDTKLEIVLSKTSMALNPLTHKKLGKFGEYTQDLVKRYPGHATLIKGIISPVKPERAIPASDFEIVGWNPDLIHYNETNLIEELQNWIYRYTCRWYNPSFDTQSSNYSAVFMAQLFQALPAVICNIRLMNCKSYRVHPFHLWSYLGGYYGLDAYQDKIVYDQALFLYRNIEHITHNSGKSETLDFLNSDFSKPYGLNLISHELVQDLDSIKQTIDIVPTRDDLRGIRFATYPYGALELLGDSTFVSVETMVDKLISEGVLNYDHIPWDVTDGYAQGRRSDRAVVPTGIIECNVATKSTDVISNTQCETLLQWLYLVSSNQYKYKMVLNLPSRGIEDIVLNAEDAVCLFLYCANMYNSTGPVGLTTLELDLPNLMFTPARTREEVISVVAPEVIDGEILVNQSTVLEWDRYEDLMDIVVDPRVVLDKDDLALHVNDLALARYRLFLLPTLEQWDDGKVQLKHMINRVIQYRRVGYNQGESYENFFARLGLDFDHDSKGTLWDITYQILDVYTGMSAASSRLRPPYTYMVEILRILCSYTIKFVEGRDAGNSTPILDPWLEPNKMKILMKLGPFKYRPCLGAYPCAIELGIGAFHLKACVINDVCMTRDIDHSTFLCANDQFNGQDYVQVLEDGMMEDEWDISIGLDKAFTAHSNAPAIFWQ